MALIFCPECGKKVSDKAAACPECGYPITELMDNSSNSSQNQSDSDGIKEAFLDSEEIKPDAEISEKNNSPSYIEDDSSETSLQVSAEQDCISLLTKIKSYAKEYCFVCSRIKQCDSIIDEEKNVLIQMENQSGIMSRFGPFVTFLVVASILSIYHVGVGILLGAGAAALWYYFVPKSALLWFEKDRRNEECRNFYDERINPIENNKQQLQKQLFRLRSIDEVKTGINWVGEERFNEKTFDTLISYFESNRVQTLTEALNKFDVENTHHSVQRNMQVNFQQASKQHGMVCPHCGAVNCTIINETYTTGKSYSAGKGCCGFILMGGPLGLLCGLCGEGKQVNNTNYWVCNSCGHKWKV